MSNYGINRGEEQEIKYEINERHQRGEDVSKMPPGLSFNNNDNNNNNSAQGGISGWVLWIGILLLINFLSWVFNWNFWLY